MIRILATGSRLWADVSLLAASLDTAAAGHDHATLIHGRCDPRTTNANYIADHQTDCVLWDAAAEDPGLGPFLGADWHAHWHAVAHGWSVEAYAANWRLHGTSAGPIRNQRMVDLRPAADVCIGAPLGKSPGTRDCMARARKAGILVRDITLPPEPEGLW